MLTVREELEAGVKWKEWVRMVRTDWVHGHAQVLDGAELPEDLADVRFFDVLR